jgi:hypothetical protein
MMSVAPIRRVERTDTEWAGQADVPAPYSTSSAAFQNVFDLKESFALCSLWMFLHDISRRRPFRDLGSGKTRQFPSIGG